MPKVTQIGTLAFCGCEKLSEIVLPKSAVTVDSRIFIYNNTRVKVVKGANTENWDKDWNKGNENQSVIYGYEVPAEFKFIERNETECSVSCTNKEFAMFADIPETAIIHGKQYTVTAIDYGGFSSCNYLERVHIPDSITYIDQHAFEQCESLTGIDLNKVERIDNWAFVQCSVLSEIVIPATVTEVGNYIFDKCDIQVKAVAPSRPDNWGSLWNAGNGNQNVIWGWFEGKAVLEYTPISETECSVSCTNIEEVTFAEVPETAIIDGKKYAVTEIGEYAFHNAKNLEEVILPETIFTLKRNAFAYCDLLTEISLPNVHSIGEQAFFLCSKLNGISLPKVVIIYPYAFDGCESLQAVDIPNVCRIDGYAFTRCTSLKEIIIPKSLTQMGNQVFNGNDTQVRVVKGTDISQWSKAWNNENKNQDVDYNYLLPAKFGFEAISDTECRVDCINKEEAMQATVPATAVIDGKEYFVTDIERAFSECVNLEKVSLPYTVTKIGNRAFYCCENLAEISTVNVREIGNEAFAFCSLVDELIIGGVTKIDTGAFRGCENLTYAEISGATELGTAVFMGCAKLETVQLIDVEKIGSIAFRGCTSLTSVNLNGVKEIGSCAFQNSGLKDIVIPATVEVMGARVFENCDTQVKAVAQSKPEGWDEQWNRNNENQNVIWGWFEGKAVFGYTPIEGTENCEVYCLNKDEVTYAEIPSSAVIVGKVYTVTKIADNAFYNCGKLQTVILPYTVTDIGSNAFADCSELEEIVISAKVATMGENVFNGCIAQIYVYADEKPEGWADNWNGDDDNITWGWKDAAGRFAYTVISETECAVSLINKLTAVEAYISAKVTIDGKEYAVTKIADGGFRGSTLLKKVVVPYTLKYIGAYAFADCPELESFSLYNTQTIEEGAFENCKKLERLFIPKSVSFVGSNILNGNNTAVYVRASSAEGWSENWNFGNGGEAEFDSKLILPVEIEPSP